MSRQRLEVAAVIRQHEERLLARYGRKLSARQRRALRDIGSCRTALLGGHIEQCDSCWQRRIAYNSCLMGSLSLWGVEQQKGLQDRQATTPLDLLHPKNRSRPVRERCRCRLKTDASIPLGRIQSP